VFWTVVDSPIDPLTLVGDETGLRELWMEGRSAPPDAVEDAGPLKEAAEQLEAYFAGELTAWDLRLVPVGTEFQLRVWAALRDIPYGRTATYGELAAGLGQPTAARAVGLANGRNPISVIQPCHRVIGADGSLTGFGGGLPRKRWLLQHEREVLAARTGEPVASGLW
jgi:methylated-DNA-[protein]-cysteine S-methyltransferase